MARSIHEEREQARRYATNIVGFAIMGVGAAFLAAAVTVFLVQGAGHFLLALILLVVGGLALVGGFFFHLVPSRIDALEERKREYDASQREDVDASGNGHAPRE